MRLIAGNTAAHCPNDDCDARPLSQVGDDNQLHPVGWLIPDSNGWWGSDGEQWDYFSNDDVNDIEYGLASAGLRTYFTDPEQKKRTKKRRIRSGYLSLPQKSTENDPLTIPGEGNTNECSISVSFKPGNFAGVAGFPNGQSDWKNRGQIVHGVGFTVDSSVSKGNAVGTMGDKPVVDGVRGNWTFDQWTSNYGVSNGNFLADPQGRPANGGEAHRDAGITTPFTRPSPNHFLAWDHPGTTGSTSGVYSNWNFLVKVYSGSQYCQVQFHITQREGIFHWGQGYLP